MKTWLKGGLIVLGLDVLFWLIFFLIFVEQAVTGRLSDIGGMAGGAIIIYSGISLIPAFVVGSIMGVLSEVAIKSNKKIITISSLIGFLIGLGISLLLLINSIVKCSSHHICNKNIIFYTILICVPFIFGWVFWIVEGIIKKLVKW